jgi:hypothetical protein
MGRLASPSALVIGSMAPDLWYFVPSVDRATSHSVGALFWFCVPLGLVAYVVFHLLLKEPLIALISPRLASFGSRGLPSVPWHAVVVSLIVGALTHLAWDELTHSNDPALPGHNWIQHANTFAGTVILAWWILRKLRLAPLSAQAPRLSALARACVLLALLGAAAIGALSAADQSPAFDLAALRQLLRSAGIASFQGFAVGVLIYCLAFHRKIVRRS